MVRQRSLGGLLAEFDFGLLAAVLLIAGMSFAVLAPLSDALGADYAVRQILWLAMGTGALLAACAVDYTTLGRFARFLYAAALGSLVYVLLFGDVVAHTKRWITLGPLTLQPSEGAKMAAILMGAVYLAEREDERDFSWGMAFALAAIFGLPAALTALQPDLGSALSFVPPLAVMLFLGGMGWRKFAAVGVLAAALAPAGWFFVLKDYQKERLVTFVHPAADPQGAGYQLLQSKIAVGSGGVTGRSAATQSSLRFLPAQHTDFVFSAFAERYGLLGVSFALAAYAFLLFRLLAVAQAAKDSLGFFLVAGVFAIAAFQVVLNLGMVIGFFPVTGLPLPWFSYGGSSLVMFMAALGLAFNVRMRRFVN